MCISLYSHLPLWSFHISTKNASTKFGFHSEVIDLVNPNVSCQNLANFPINVSFAFGGLLEDKVPLVCGGYNDQFKSEFGQSKCFTVGFKEVKATLTQPRFYGAGVVISKHILCLP